MADPSRLGRYQLRRVLGKGAMGVVYEGFDPSLNRSVAVKTILKSVVTDEESAAGYSARFAREAKAVARLSHPHIVQVYDFGEENDIAYLVMEFIQGRELRSSFESRERFDAAEAVRIMSELLGALEFAHEAGVIHRDVKPANVMLDAQRRVKLADFGVARIQDGTDRSKGGTMVGTPAFMSPEQISGKKVDRRTDLFSAGVILYQLLTGEQPFKGEGAWTVAKQIMQDEPPRPSTIAGKVSSAFDQIVNRALAKKPEDRYASAKEFAAALQGALAGGTAQRGSDAEIEFWRSIQASNDPAEYEVYLKEFPTGVYADLARVKIAKLPRLVPGMVSTPPASAATIPPRDTKEVAKLAEEKFKLEAELAQREAEFRKREAEAAARQVAEAKARAEADARREAEAKARAAAEEKARLAAIEKAKNEAQAELAKREAEYQKREADARAKAEAEAKARHDLEEKAKKEAELRAKAEVEARAKREAEEKVRREADAKARAEAEARAKKEAEGRAKREAEAAKREAQAAKREAELKKKLAEAPRTKAPVVSIAIAMVVIVAVAAGGRYWYTVGENARVAELTAALEAATKASKELDQARLREEELNKAADVARAAEDAARKSGDLAKLKELQEATKNAEAEAQKQNELVKQREAESQRADKAAKDAQAKKMTDATSAEKAAQEKAAQEKAAQIKATEKAVAEKAAAEKATAEKASAEKAAVDKLAADKAAAEKVVADKRAAEKLAAQREDAAKSSVSAAKSGWPHVGDRWIYEAREVDYGKTYPVTVEVKEVTASSVRDVRKIDGRGEIERVNKPGTYPLFNFGPGIYDFSPYLSVFQEIHVGESWSQVEWVGTKCSSGVINCIASARVVSQERVTVKAGSFETWKIDVEGQWKGEGRSGLATITFWYAEGPRRFVKYRFRNPNSGTEPSIDMELVSYIPAAEKIAETPSVPKMRAQSWEYVTYDNSTRARIAAGYVTMEESGGKITLRILAKGLDACGNRWGDATVVRTEATITIAVVPTLRGCDDFRLVIKNDGTGGQKELKRGSEWEWDGFDRALTPRK